MKLNEIRDNQGARKSKIRVGRGIGSGKGKTGGRGQKGQKSREGVSIAGFEGGQMPLHRRLPKRGFTNIFRVEYLVLGLDRIAEFVAENNAIEVTPETLQARGILKKRNGLVKVLANGEITTAVTVHAHKFSGAAKKAIEAAGGKAIVVGAESASVGAE